MKNISSSLVTTYYLPTQNWARGSLGLSGFSHSFSEADSLCWGSPTPHSRLLLSRATENVKTRLRIFTSQPENKYYGRLLQWILRRSRKRLFVYFDLTIFCRRIMPRHSHLLNILPVRVSSHLFPLASLCYQRVSRIRRVSGSGVHSLHNILGPGPIQSPSV